MFFKFSHTLGLSSSCKYYVSSNPVFTSSDQETVMCWGKTSMTPSWEDPVVETSHHLLSSCPEQSYKVFLIVSVSAFDTFPIASTPVLGRFPALLPTSCPFSSVWSLGTFSASHRCTVAFLSLAHNHSLLFYLNFRYESPPTYPAVFSFQAKGLCSTLSFSLAQMANIIFHWRWCGASGPKALNTGRADRAVENIDFGLLNRWCI